MAKIKGFSILTQADWDGVIKYINYWDELVDIEVTPFMEANEWLHMNKLPFLPFEERTPLEQELTNRGWLARWSFEYKDLEQVLRKWKIYKEEYAGNDGYPINGDGVE